MNQDKQKKLNPGSVKLTETSTAKEVKLIVEVYKKSNGDGGWLAYRTNSLGVLGKILYAFAKREIEFTYNGRMMALHEVCVYVADPKEIYAVNEIFAQFGSQVFYGDVLNKKRITIKWQLPEGHKTVTRGDL